MQMQLTNKYELGTSELASKSAQSCPFHLFCSLVSFVQ